MTRKWKPLATLIAVAALALAACGSSASDGSPATTKPATSGSPTTARPLEGDLTVAAAASLTEAFTQIGKDFEAAHPGTKVTFTFDSSGTLSQQIIDGAPVDVFASADEKNEQKVADAGLVKGDPTVFARNRLIIVTKPGNPTGIKTLADLADAGVISLCGTDVPCGTFAATALSTAGVTIPESSVTRGQNAKATLTAVSEGDAVAGIVYVTDAQAAGSSVASVEIPADQNVVATYPIAVLTGTKDDALATAFADYVASDAGQSVLADAGFLPPS